MIASSWWKVGLGMVGAAGILVSSNMGCGSDTGSASTSTGGDTTSTTSSGGTGGAGTGSGGTGGDSTTTGSPATTSTGTTTGSSTTTTGGGSSTSSTSSTGTGMMSNYADCEKCTNIDMGAPSKECKTAYDACFGNPNCKQIYNCAYDQGSGCSTDAAGACCTYGCFDKLKATLPNDPAAAMTAINLYKAYDACLYCSTCKVQCTAEPYCTKFNMGQAGCN